MAALTIDPAVGMSADGRLEVFMTGNDGELYHIWQQAFDNDKSWSGWFSHGNPRFSTLLGTPVVRSYIGNDTVELYVAGTDNTFYGINQTVPNNGWTAWQQLSLPPGVALTGQIEVGTRIGTRRSIFVVGINGVIYHQQDYDRSWLSFGGAFLYAPTMALSADGRQELFAVGKNGVLYHRYETVVSYELETWTTQWLSHGTPPGTLLTGKPAMAANADGRLELFVAGTDGNLYQIAQTAPSNGWTNWSAFGAPAGVKLASSPAVKASNDGRLELFVVGDDGALYHIWQVAVNNAWSPWFSHGNPPAGLSGSPTLGVHVTSPWGVEFPPPPTDLRLVVFVGALDGNLYHLWQVAPNNGWGNWVLHGHP